MTISSTRIGFATKAWIAFALTGACAGWSVGGSKPAGAQTCASQILATNLPTLNIYAVPTGPSVGSIRAQDIPPGTRIVECHPNLRVMVRVGGRDVWIDGWGVRTDAAAPVQAMPRPRKSTGGGPGLSD